MKSVSSTKRLWIVAKIKSGWYELFLVDWVFWQFSTRRGEGVFLKIGIITSRNCQILCNVYLDNSSPEMSVIIKKSQRLHQGFLSFFTFICGEETVCEKSQLFL